MKGFVSALSVNQLVNRLPPEAVENASQVVEIGFEVVENGSQVVEKDLQVVEFDLQVVESNPLSPMFSTEPSVPM